MAFCRNCGSKLTEGVKFCEGCGTKVSDEGFLTNNSQPREEKQNTEEDMKDAEKKQKEDKKSTAFEKFSKFFGIFLLLIAFLDFYSDPPILTIILSLAIMALAVFCLSQKYRLKGFTIVALILAICCFFCGVMQGKELGFLKVPKDSDYEEVYNNTEDALEESLEIKEKEEPVVSKKTDSDNEVDSVAEVTEETTTKTADGVDPELKAFLDSYEEFMDEYVAFMKKYSQDPGNALLMLNDYADIMEKYADFSEKIEQYDEKDMSTADAKYYLEVTTRVYQKMLEVY